MTQNLETVKEMIDKCDYVKTIIWQNTVTKSKDKWQTGRNSFWPTSQTKGWVSNVLRILKNWSNKGPETQLEIRKKIWTDNPHMQNKNKIKKSLKQRQYVQN